MLPLLFAFMNVAPAMAADNGLALSPPMGWRSWNQYSDRNNQDIMMSVMDAIVARNRLVDGKPTSLCDVGYCDVGIDDYWQTCGSSPIYHYQYHDDDGNPIVNTSKFPDMSAITEKAHSLGLTAGWYMNNCDPYPTCCESCNEEKCYLGDALALHKFGFDAVKLDNCGQQLDLDLWFKVLNATGKPVVIENCHIGFTLPTADWCPFHFYRTSGDIRAAFSSVLWNLMTVMPLAKSGLSKPGCWAYPDMLEVGCDHGAGGDSDPGLSDTETRSHFGAWCIVSSPLTLSNDLQNDAIMDKLWPVITNVEAIRINQAYFGHSGSNFTSVGAGTKVKYAANLGIVEVEEKLYFYKPMSSDGTKVAVLLINAAQSGSMDLTVAFKDVPGLLVDDNDTVIVRDVWARTDVAGEFRGEFTASSIEYHDCAFLMLTVKKTAASAVAAII